MNKLPLHLLFGVFIAGLTACNGTRFAKQTDVDPTLAYGAETFQVRCVLCHGNQGHGDGLLPVSLKKYPNTNLYDVRHGRSTAKVRRAILYGGSRGKMSNEMPPWANELTCTQIESVVMFTRHLRTKPDEAHVLLEKAEKQSKPTARLGRVLYRNYCSLCHGPNGEGDGKMARIIKNPPPFNLTLSRAPDVYLQNIVLKGGEAMGRSPRMPPWTGQLTKDEVQSIILHLKSLRR